MKQKTSLLYSSSSLHFSLCKAQCRAESAAGLAIAQNADTFWKKQVQPFVKQASGKKICGTSLLQTHFHQTAFKMFWSILPTKLWGLNSSYTSNPRFERSKCKRISKIFFSLVPLSHLSSPCLCRSAKRRWSEKVERLHAIPGKQTAVNCSNFSIS